MEYKLNAQKLAKLGRVSEAVLREVRPSSEERKAMTAKINTVMGRIKGLAPKGVEIMVAGSAARGTELRGNSDVDIFLLFNKPVPKERMEKVSVDVAKRMVKGRKNESYIVKYAEHPYARILLDDIGLRIDLVPAYKIRSAKEMATSVDRTQLHNEFIKSRLNKQQQDEVRLLKALLRFHSIYGAEARVEGFSGYLCELLIYTYGSFPKLLVAIANAKMPLVVDHSGEGLDPRQTAEKFEKKLVVIDPTDKERNVAANVSDDSLARFVLLCRALLADPSLKSFNGEGYSDLHSGAKLSGIARRLGVGLYAIAFKSDDIADEIVWQQLKRLMNSMASELSKLGFTPLLSLQEVVGTDAVIGFMINDFRKQYKLVIGPSALMRDAAASFALAHPAESVIFRSLESDRLYVVEKADCTTPEEAIRHLLKSVKIPSHFRRGMKLYVNAVPEGHAKMLYKAYWRKTSL
ncbi:MAG: CCA tRNA nucleotidyltransferase [Candidatus Micrarchaeota archaeon]|nr:CCA tRNA nucleotidyltransferase [Candidatus Micrarchaeota archaeon]